MGVWGSGAAPGGRAALVGSAAVHGDLGVKNSNFGAFWGFGVDFGAFGVLCWGFWGCLGDLGGLGGI